MAITGGKVNLIQPVAFASQLVSIGDLATDVTNTLTTSFTDSMVIGSGSSIGGITSILRSLVVGIDSDIVRNCDDSVVIGYESHLSYDSPRGVLIGANSFINAGSPSAIVIGNVASIDMGSGSTVAIGPGVTNKAGTFAAIVIGSYASAYGGPSNSVTLGPSTTLGAGSSINIGSNYIDTGYHLIAIGQNVNVSGVAFAVSIGRNSSALSNYAIALGSDSYVDMLSNDSIAIGNQANVHTLAPRTMAVGYQSQVHSGADYSFAIGPGAQCGPSSGYSIVIGHDPQIQGNCSECILIGNNSIISGDYPYWTSHCIVIGSNSIATGYSYIAGFDIIVLGPNSYANSPYSLLIGSTNNVNVNSDISVLIGYDNLLQYSAECCAIGLNTTIYGGRSSTVVGFGNSISLASYSLALGNDNIINDNSAFSPDQGNAHIVTGCNNTLNDGTYGSVVFGVGNTLTGSSYSTVLGRIITVEGGDRAIILGNESELLAGSNPNYVIMLGSNQSVSAAQTITLGLYAENNTPNTMVIGTSTYATPGMGAIHTMTIVSGGALNTLIAKDNPTNPGETGLSVVCNIGSVLSNQVIKADASPAGTPLYLYILP
jgi:hypothetical protein